MSTGQLNLHETKTLGGTLQRELVEAPSNESSSCGQQISHQRLPAWLGLATCPLSKQISGFKMSHGRCPFLSFILVLIRQPGPACRSLLHAGRVTGGSIWLPSNQNRNKTYTDYTKLTQSLEVGNLSSVLRPVLPSFISEVVIKLCQAAA